MAHACGLTLTLDDFQRVSDRVPFIADLKPSGKYVMEDVHKVSAGVRHGGNKLLQHGAGRQARLGCSSFAGAPRRHAINHPPAVLPPCRWAAPLPS